MESLVARHGRVLLEELIEGVEITVPMLGHQALPAVEIVKPDGKVFDHQTNYDGSMANSDRRQAWTPGAGSRPRRSAWEFTDWWEPVISRGST
jgi:D-ala D-ala ligase C-terminus